MKKFFVFLVLVALVGAGVVVAAERDPKVAAWINRAAVWAGAKPPFDAAKTGEAAGERWRTTPVERGTLQSAVLATGTLQPVQTVQVSSQVSGQIVELIADFNSKVKPNDVIARLDPTTFQGKVASAEADLAVAEASIRSKQATLARARSELVRIDEAARDSDRALDRARQLVKTGAVTERSVEQAEVLKAQTYAQVVSSKADIALAEAEIRVAEANVEQKRAAVRIARTDLDRATIRSPIDGIVIDRQVELGQTVAASLSAPTLFVIAAALEEMQLEASIDEADIGRVREGQQVAFTVDAYPGRGFEGRVSQVRRAPKSVQNVVTYTAVVTADNSSGALFPGMTANVRLIVDTRKDVLRIPQAALRFRPAQPVADGQAQGGQVKRARTVNATAEEGRRARIYLLGADGGLKPVEVRVGLAADTMVEVSGDGVQAGDRVVTGRLDDAPERRRAPLGF
ncbi:efflux RND transporter periplasmic adaptor subunit [Prosthecomicrobium hirschii]|uniref:efflux RND transporter periplasmic adaptor subunit n=1 Tax=Prosthecodimorpha hirschii TaxID=665126 RepID=UPI0011268E05|nr:efflux RND transporter periplasmic adaptor subunit [Prosthecomicrobium hirschii]TPQ49244.1 efflux RND transporter periplasmic adaptor subunit [Prosthecomicrobium hirschii]